MSENIALPHKRAALALLAAVGVAAAVPATGAAQTRVTYPGAHVKPAVASTFKSQVFADGSKIMHQTASGKEAIANPDDITTLRGDIFVGFQNGVGPQGEPSTTGNRDSTIVEFSRRGKELAQWDVKGKCDGVTADPLTGKLIATVNEDAHSSVYLITPKHGTKPVHFRYNVPLPSNGGTDAISIYHGHILISASAPGTTGAPAPQAKYPALYDVKFDAAKKLAVVHGVFSDEAMAKRANKGQSGSVKLKLTDPDSNEVVPAFAKRFAGDFMLTSQGDEEQIYFHGVSSHPRLSVLKLARSVDDTAWPAGRSGALYTTDNDNGTIYKITGPFKRGSEISAVTPCDENGAPTTCPAPGYPGNYLAQVNSSTGKLTPLKLTGPKPAAQGLLYLP